MKLLIIVGSYFVVCYVSVECDVVFVVVFYCLVLCIDFKNNEFFDCVFILLVVDGDIEEVVKFVECIFIIDKINCVVWFVVGVYDFKVKKYVVV